MPTTKGQNVKKSTELSSVKVAKRHTSISGTKLRNAYSISTIEKETDPLLVLANSMPSSLSTESSRGRLPGTFQLTLTELQWLHGTLKRAIRFEYFNAHQLSAAKELALHLHSFIADERTALTEPAPAGPEA